MLANNYKMVHKTTQDSIVRLESRFRRFVLPDPSNVSGLAGLDFVKDLINHHVLLANLLLSMLPNTRLDKIIIFYRRKLIKMFRLPKPKPNRGILPPRTPPPVVTVFVSLRIL